MWPLEPVVREYLRIGSASVERWAGNASRIDCVAAQPLFARPRPSTHSASWPELEAALRVLYTDKPKTTVTLLLESALMPTLLVEAGPELWAPTHVQALLRHRLNSLYAEPGTPADAWDTRMDHRAGDRFALGFGLRTSLKYVLLEACASAGVDCRRLLPALAWGMARLNVSRQWPVRRGWLGWAEQDRLLLAHLVSGRVVALNAAARIPSDSAAAIRQVDGERLRFGLSQSGPILVTRWNHAPDRGAVSATASEPAVTWVEVGHAADAADGSMATSKMASQT